MAHNCPTRTKLATLAQELSQEKEKQVTRLHRLYAINTSSETRKRHLYIEAKFRDRMRWGLLNTGADTSYLSEGVARELGISWGPSKGHFKSINGTWMNLVGEARNVPLSIGTWLGTTNFTIAPMDDYELVFEMEFLDQVKPLLVPGKDTMLIMHEDRPCLVKFKREGELSPNQEKKGLPHGERTFAAMVFEEELPTDKPANEVLTPPMIEGVLKEFQDVMPDELPKELSPRREVNHEIELIEGAKHVAKAPYRMCPTELKELKSTIKGFVV